MTAPELSSPPTRRPTIAEVIAGLDEAENALADALGHERPNHDRPTR